MSELLSKHENLSKQSKEPYRTLQATWVFMSWHQWHHLSSVVIYRLFWPAYYSSYEMTTRTDVMIDKILFLLLSWHQIFTYLFTCFAYGLTFVRCIRVFVSFFTYLAASFEFQKLCYFIVGPICNKFVALFHWSIYESAIKSFKIELNLT